MTRKTKDDRIQISYYPDKKVREKLMNPSLYGYASRNDLIDQAVLDLINNIEASTKEKPLNLLMRMAGEAAIRENVRLYQHVKASYQQAKMQEDLDLGLALLRAYSRMSDPPIDTEKEADIWRGLINGE